MKKFKAVEANVNLAKMEEKILKFWQDNKIFEKSIQKNPLEKEFTFYDGPPFATGLPHYGHIVPGTLKDIIPRYWTMKGYRVERRFGWDCHGLPIEHQLEKELKIKNKKEIEAMGIGEFNEKCRCIVLRYTKEWEQIIPRLGRWVDFKNDYKTMDAKYMESIWWVFKQLWDKGLIYEGYKSLHICPRCATPLSNFEVTLGYKDRKDPSIVVKFPLKNRKNTYFLAWTTTPWTLPANVLLAVNPKAVYVEVETAKSNFIIAKKRMKDIFKDVSIKKTKSVVIKEILGQEYEPLYRLAQKGTHYKLAFANFVSLEEGTGIVHVAPGFGEDDYLLGQKEKAPIVQHITQDGLVNEKLAKYKGISVWELNNKVIEDLKGKDLLFSLEQVNHSYPFCWRCDTPLLNYATKTWFVAVTKIKDKLIKNNQKISWVPKNVKYGRFGKWLEGAKDWGISRSRFWGTPIPVWRGEKTGVIEVIGSIKELEEKTGKKINDLHLHKIRKLGWLNNKTGEKMKLSGEVLDCWFESGSMPYASKHYPFENKEWLEDHFPADFIAESLDQTRGWFYTLHVLSTALFDKPAFKNVITNGVVLAEDGQKMSKSKNNFPDPMLLVQKYSADALRFYLMSSPVIKGEDLCFSEKGVLELTRNLFLRLWNIYRFFVNFANLDHWQPKKSNPEFSVLDKWILNKLNQVVFKTTRALEKYDVALATSYFDPFIKDLSTWYLRRCRDRVGLAAEKKDKEAFYQVTFRVLVTLSELMAPFAPFISEEIYKNLTGSKSVHLSNWPKTEKKIDQDLLSEMKLVREICELGHAARKKLEIKVRQPLREFRIMNSPPGTGQAELRMTINKSNYKKELIQLIKEELNVKEIVWLEGKELEVELDTKITPKLKQEGEAREIIRQIQEARKKAGCRMDELITVVLPSWPKSFSAIIKKKTLTKKITKGKEFAIDRN